MQLQRDAVHLFLDNKKRALEVGVQNLHYTKYLCDHFDLVVGCDPYKSFDPDFYKDASNGDYLHMEWLYFQVLKEAKNLPNLILMREESLKIYNWFPDNFFDYVYLDGNHMYHYLSRELKLFWPKVKPGGILAGHDFTDYENQDTLIEVKKTVTEWAEKMNLEFTVANHDGGCGSWFIRKI